MLLHFCSSESHASQFYCYCLLLLPMLVHTSSCASAVDASKHPGLRLLVQLLAESAVSVAVAGGLVAAAVPYCDSY